MMRKILAIILFCIPFCPMQGRDCYSEYWQQFFWNMHENDCFAVGTFLRLETGDHFKKIRFMQFNEQFRWKVSKNFSLEIHYAYLEGRSIVPNSPRRWQHRLELEANPAFDLPNNWRVNTRNRLEIRRVETEPKILYRFRQRTMLVIPFKDKGIFKSYSIFNEIFYDISTHLFTQDRLCPVQLTIAVSDKLDLDLFFMMRLFRENAVWHQSAVLGTQLTF